METSKFIRTSRHRNAFDEYFYKAIHHLPITKRPAAPYISISRDMGCMANTIAMKLAEAINRKLFNNPQHWDWINKSILIESSRALELNPSKIEYVFQSRKKSTMDEIIGAMSTRYYKNDKKIRTTITKVIKAIAQNGRIIIVGRGGIAFAKDNPHSLHIKLVAPLQWRVKRISKVYNISLVDAEQYVNQIDQERKYLIDSFHGFKTDLSIFDLVLNRKTMSEEEIVSIILNLMQTRKLIV